MSPRILAFCICYLSIAIVIFNTIIVVYEIKDYTTHCTNTSLIENQALRNGVCTDPFHHSPSLYSSRMCRLCIDNET